MSILSWGKCSIQTVPSVNGAPAANAVWVSVDTPKDGTTQITVTAGTETVALEEGGDVVDARTGKNTYQLEFDLFVKKGHALRQWPDIDGIIAGEHAFRVIPEDPACEGAQIDRATLRVEETYNTADGKMLHYVARCLKPASGNTVKPFYADTLELDKTQLYFSNAADSTGKTVTVTSASAANVTASSSETWATTTVSGKVVTVKATANTTGAVRTAVVTISATDPTSGTLTGHVEVTQIPA